MNTPRDRSVRVAQAILDGTIDVVQGCRALAALRHDVGMPGDKDFLVFAAIDSEADGWPDAEVRDRFSADYLKRTDAEKRVYLSEVDDEIRAACKRLLARMNT